MNVTVVTIVKTYVITTWLITVLLDWYSGDMNGSGIQSPAAYNLYTIISSHYINDKNNHFEVLFPL